MFQSSEKRRLADSCDGPRVSERSLRDEFDRRRRSQNVATEIDRPPASLSQQALEPEARDGGEFVLDWQGGLRASIRRRRDVGRASSVVDGDGKAGPAATDHIAVIQFGDVDATPVDSCAVRAGHVDQAADRWINFDQELKTRQRHIRLRQLEGGFPRSTYHEGVVPVERERLPGVGAIQDSKRHG